MQPVQEVYDDRAAVSRKQELIQTVLTDVKTHEVTIEINLADMLESRFIIKTDESANNNKETKRITREGGKLLKPVSTIDYIHTCTCIQGRGFFYGIY